MERGREGGRNVFMLTVVLVRIDSEIYITCPGERHKEDDDNSYNYNGGREGRREEGREGGREEGREAARQGGFEGGREREGERVGRKEGGREGESAERWHMGHGKKHWILTVIQITLR